MRISPAMQATTSGKTGSHRESATTQPPILDDIVFPRSYSFFPSNRAAALSPTSRQSQYAKTPEANDPAALINPPIHGP